MNDIPIELTTRPQWVTWRYEEGTKVPYRALSSRKASSTDGLSWSTFEQALSAAQQRSDAGVGYVFSPDDPFTGIDLDDCVDDQGYIATWAEDIITSLNSYTEISPSKHGVKIWVQGKIPSAVKTKYESGGIEMYSEGRYFTVTGEHLDGTPMDIRDANGALTALYQALKPTEPEPVAPEYTAPVELRERNDLNDYYEDWAKRKITWAISQVAFAAEGEKHNKRLDMSRLLGGLIPLGLATENQIEAALFGANVPRNEAQRKERKAIRDGIKMGIDTPLKLPDPPPQPTFDKDGIAYCPFHNVALPRSKNGNGYKCHQRDTGTETGYCAFWWKGEGYIPPVIQVGEILIKTKPSPLSMQLAASPDWISMGVTLSELQSKIFIPERWVVENILPEGACLLAAKPKSRKSWLALAVGITVAMNGKALGRLGVSAGRVLYLDLEGKQQRIQKRTRAMLGVQQVAWPDNFHVFTKWPQGDAALEQLEYWFRSHPDTALVVTDVLGNFRRPIDRYEQPYQYDRDTVTPINEILEGHHAAGILVHHVNKAKHDDVIDSISGTTGLPSAVNTMWILGRDPNDSNMTIFARRGRDLENEDPLALRWDTYLNMHVIEGSADEVAISSERKRVLQVMDDDIPRGPKEIAAATGKPVESVKQLLRKLLNDGLIDKVGYGEYAIVRKPDHSDHSSNSDHSDHSSNSLKDKSDRDSSRVIGYNSTDHSYLKHQNASNGKSDRSDRYLIGPENIPEFSYSVDCALIDGRELWRVWQDRTNNVVSTHSTEAEANTEAQRRARDDASTAV